MSIKYPKTQDYLSVNGHKALVRHDGSHQLDSLTTSAVTRAWIVTAPIIRLDGLAIAAGAAIAAGSLTIDVIRVRDGVAPTSLLTAPIVLDATNVTGTDLIDLSDNLDDTKDLLPEDRVELTATPSVAPAPTETHVVYLFQGAMNGDD